jgi:L-glyceraldehyde 3-phosphate reductase
MTDGSRRPDPPDSRDALDASRLALGSWHVFSRLTLDEGISLVRTALELGITFFDVGDYWDHETSNEARFGEVIRNLGVSRDEFRIGIKVFTNSERTRADLVSESLQRLGIESADYVVCSRPAAHESLDDAVCAMADLVARGLTSEVAVSLWTPELLKDALNAFAVYGFAAPRYIQLQYNVCRRDVVESPAYNALLEESGLRLQAANTLEGGILAGHLMRSRFDPGDRAKGRWFSDRNIARDSGGIRRAIREKVPKLELSAGKLGVTPAQLAMAFCLLHPALDTLLFGATTGNQLRESIGALDLARERPEQVVEAVENLLVPGAAPPALFDVTAGMH